MPLIIEGGRVPTRWAERLHLGPVLPIDGRVRHPDWISLALINNMPDPALEDTEFQFFELAGRCVRGCSGLYQALLVNGRSSDGSWRAASEQLLLSVRRSLAEPV